MKRERKTLDILGVIRICYRKKPDHLAAVVEGCVRERSVAGVYSTDSVVLRNVKVVEVACRKGTASVGFKARVYRDGRSGGAWAQVVVRLRRDEEVEILPLPAVRHPGGAADHRAPAGRH